MTDTDPPSEKDSLPPPWLIVTGIIVALGVIFLLGVGYQPCPNRPPPR
jgi:hypothetical protein